MALQICPEARELAKKYIAHPLADRIFLAYLPSVPASGQGGPQAAAELMRYCIITGVLFRTWVVHKTAEQGFSSEGFRGSPSDVVNEALARRKKRLEGYTGSLRQELNRVIRREGQILKTLVLKI